jgi:hypothetical protein
MLSPQGIKNNYAVICLLRQFTEEQLRNINISTIKETQNKARV